MADEIARYEIQSSKSSLALEIFKKGILAGKRHVLFFEKFLGEIQYDHQQPQRSRLDFVLDCSSVRCEDNWLTSKQRKKVVSFALEELLIVDRYPQIKFSSTVIIRQAINQYEMQGDLTIRGTTRRVSVQVATKPSPERLEIDGEAVLRMKDYGMKPPTELLGLSGTRNRMKLRFVVWADRAVAERQPAN